MWRGVLCAIRGLYGQAQLVFARRDNLGFSRYRHGCRNSLRLFPCSRLETRVTSLLSGLLLISFAVTMTMALGVKAPLNFSVFSAAGGALLLGVCESFPFSLDELLQTRRQRK
jgi:hypothetical protein